MGLFPNPNKLEKPPTRPEIRWTGTTIKVSVHCVRKIWGRRWWRLPGARCSSWVDNGAVRVWSMLRFDWSAVAAVWPCWCRALLLIATWKKPDAESGAERPSDGSRIRTRVCAPRCCGCISGKSLCERGICFLTVAPTPDRRNKPSAFCWTATVFPPLTKWQPCCRQPGSPVAFCERGGTGEASGSALFPPLRRGGLPSLLLWLEIQPRSGEWRTAMWAKKAKGLP